MALVTMGKKEWLVQLNRFGKVDYNKLNSYLKSNGLKLQYVGNGYGTFVESEGTICVMTYHSSKGLDFDNVFLPGLNQSLYINSNEHLSRTLFMVAMTRSRLNLYLLHSGSKSAYLSNFMSDCNRINVHDILNGQNTKLGGNNIFGI
jgi:superfamily I DNA/RNA helicase